MEARLPQHVLRHACTLRNTHTCVGSLVELTFLRKLEWLCLCKQAQGAEHAQADCFWIIWSLVLVGQIGNHCGQHSARCSVAYPPWFLPTVMLERIWVSLGHCLVWDGKDCGSPCNCTTSAVHHSVHTVEALIPQPCLCSLAHSQNES